MKYSKLGFFISFLCLVILCISEPVFAEESLFDQANQAYSQDEFDRAIALYQKVIDNKGFSASLLYNLGNCYAQKGETGQAVLHYKRALRLAPKNADILKNLHHVREEAGLFVAERTAVDKIVQLMTINQWTLLSLFFLFAITALVICWRKISNKTQATTTIVILTLLLICCLVVTADRYQAMPDSVVISKDVPLRISPFERSESKGLIKEGRLVSVIKKHKDYLYIKDETGRTGWVIYIEIMKITP